MDPDTFLTTLYVMIDDFCQSAGFAEKHRPGPAASLSCSEVVTLAVFGQWARFASERAFYRYARRHLRSAFPTLPAREQFNRLQRSYRDAIVAFALFLVEQMQAQQCLYEALDSSGIPTRDAKRRGTGWLAGQAAIGWSNRIGWYEGVHLLSSISPTGVITGFGFAPASCNDHVLADTFFAARRHPSPRLPSVGAPAQGVYVADKGFAGDHLHERWYTQYGAEVVSPPHQRSKVRWSKEWRRWLAGLRQIIESIYDKLLNTFRLARERPHALDGLQTRLAAKVALHNFCLRLNQRLGRDPLAFADLLDW
ncbi:MAG TPA: transposase [Ktedonobacteraceae bacterium]|nr:transposase [Ktedonobacteraceae bacterium]